LKSLHHAASGGDAACVALLVERGANKEATDNVRCARAAAINARCIDMAASAQR
jgi:ankyrin repeat protein